MYAKIFQSIYDGSIARDWQLRLVFMDFLVLADRKGVVDMTADAISRRTGVPLEIVKEGITKLEAPDPDSRRPEMNGKRIERLDNHRLWGWRIVNYQHYRNLMSIEQKQEIDRLRLKAKRDAQKNQDQQLEIGLGNSSSHGGARKGAGRKSKNPTNSTNVGGCRVSSQPVADVAQAEAEAEAEAYTKKTPPIYISPPLGQFGNVLLTPDQQTKLVQRFGNAEANEKIEALSEYLEKIGSKSATKKYRSHYAAILCWDRMAKDKHKLPEGWA